MENRTGIYWNILLRGAASKTGEVYFPEWVSWGSVSIPGVMGWFLGRPWLIIQFCTVDHYLKFPGWSHSLPFPFKPPKPARISDLILVEQVVPLHSFTTIFGIPSTSPWSCRWLCHIPMCSPLWFWWYKGHQWFPYHVCMWKYCHRDTW